MNINDKKYLFDTEAVITGIYMPGTHINFTRELGDKYYAVTFKVKQEEKKIVLPEWLLNLLPSKEEIVKKEKELKERIEAEIHQELDKNINQHIQGKIYDRQSIAR